MSATAARRPDASEHSAYFSRYVALVPDGDILAVLRRDRDHWQTLIAGLSEAKAGHRYAEGKWSIREVIGHVSDSERVFSYRAFRIARGVRTPLASFDQDEYVKTAGSDQRTLSSLSSELLAVRESTLSLFTTLPEEAWARTGTASDNPVSVRALAYITAGHAQHHLRIVREQYLGL
jgi:transposase